jgi:SAM-dependent methyltransferase
MPDALTYLATKYSLDLHDRRLPIAIPNVDRDTLARLFHLLGYQIGVEVGVERGVYSEVLCRENPGVQLYCIDAWRTYRGYKDHVDQQKLNRFYEETQARLAPYPRATLVRAFSQTAVKDFAIGSLDFVYIDAAHDFQNCTNDIAEWGRRVRPGGIIAGHDFASYAWPNQIHVVPVVRGWTEAYEIAPWFLLGRDAKVEGELRDRARSWFWVQAEPRPFRSGPKVHQ